jgi:hypothetical protein
MAAATGGASAEDAPFAQIAPQRTGGSAFVVFWGQDLDAISRFTSAGAKIRPLRPIGDDRLVLLASAGGGTWMDRRALALRRESDSGSFRAHLSAGTELVLAGGSLGLFLGSEYWRETGTDPVGAVLRRDRRWGLRGQIDWWSNPTPDTLLTATLVASGAKRDLWTRAAFGWRVGGWGFVGPEATLSASSDSRKVRFGAHWSELEFSGFRFRLGAGWSRESGQRAGAYLSLGGYRPF